MAFGQIKQAKAKGRHGEAAKAAREAGQMVFAYKVIEEIGQIGYSGPIGVLDRAIEAIEEHGWRLEHVQTEKVEKLTGDRRMFYLIFRRS
ncbi:hypothetical protein [Streptomyces sp. CBMA123]|uniref:hypothetical protein n=1 Tax=Streptomyces sp. CBMA123 TaxID=1896313 RepID=UPI001661B84A|nr:hypothetical protein [Streptomyces sp. CBMA123]MBD0689643.1 hypothetical protein [Streptomyces sp. CBMA123]